MSMSSFDPGSYRRPVGHAARTNEAS